MKDIFKENGVHILNLNSWTKYAEKKDLKKGCYSEYFKKNENPELSVGVFYKLNQNNEKTESIDYIAWGLRKNKDCSFNAKVRENKYIENIIAGCPCDEDGGKNKITPIYIFIFLTIILSILYSHFFQTLNFLNFMSNYMAFFFLMFGSLKISNIKSFAKMFSEYDLIAKRSKLYGYIYPYLEIILSVLFFTIPHNFYLNTFTAILMLINSIGIYKFLILKNQTKCACLGGYFNVPLSWITFWENFIMFLMSLFML